MTIRDAERWCKAALNILQEDTKAGMPRPQWRVYLKIWEFAAQYTQLDLREIVRPSDIKLAEEASDMPHAFAEFINGLNI